MANFLIKNTAVFKQYFLMKECGQAVGELYTMDDVYDQITHIVDAVSYKLLNIVFSEFIVVIVILK